MKRLASALDIAAPPERIWEQLTDFGSFPSWNPFILRASGPLQVGNRIEITLKLGKSERTFRPTLSKLEPNRELRWLAQIGPRGVFDVERIFELQALGDGRTRFAQSEVCTGLLEPVLFIGGKLERDILHGYDAFAHAIKQRVERPPATPPGAHLRGESPRAHA
jgi:hypothetical protein